MDYKAEIRDALKGLVREMLINASIQAEVVSVDKQAGTIEARGIREEVNYYDVRLKAVAVDGNGAGVLAYPVVGSQVCITILDGVDTLAFVSQCSDIEEYSLTLANGVHVRLTGDGKLLLNGDRYEGLVKAPELKRQLDKTNALLVGIKQVLTTWTPVPGDGGAALKVAATAALASKLPGDFSDIQNTDVKHG